MPEGLDEFAEIFVDGAARGNPGPSGIGYVIRFAGQTVTHSEYLGERTNNQAEYTALAKALEHALSMGVRKAKVYSDSVLLVKQVNGEYRVRNPVLAQLHQRVKALVGKFQEFRISYIDRQKNLEADKLANAAIDRVKPSQ